MNCLFNLPSVYSFLCFSALIAEHVMWLMLVKILSGGTWSINLSVTSEVIFFLTLQDAILAF